MSAEDSDEYLVIPDPIELDIPASSIEFHASEHHLACGCVDGSLLYLDARPGSEDVSELLHLSAHKDSVRSISFVSATQLVTGSADRSIAAIDISAGSVISRRQGSHSAPITKTYSYQHMLASGDEGGTVKVWDLRQRKAAFSFGEQRDYISDLLLHPGENTLLATSGDGSLAIFDLRNGRSVAESVSEDSDFLSLELLLGGAQVAVGTGSGDILIFGWGRWELYDVSFSGHPEAVDALFAIDESVLITGSADGLLRLVSIAPNQFLGLIGEVPDEYPVEAMAANHDHTMLATSSHDSAVRFWDVSYVPSKKRSGDTLDINEEAGADWDEQPELDFSKMYVKKTPRDERKEFFADLKE